MVSPDTLTTQLTQRILDNLNTVVLLFNQELRLSYLNPAAEMLLAASARQLKGTSLAELLAHEAGAVESFQRALDSGHPYTDRETSVHLPSGRTITADCTVTPIYEAGQPRDLLVELHPMDRQRRVQREENLLTQHLATRALVRGLAHEIKNPLGGLRGAAQLLERQLHDDELKEYTSIIIGEADRLQNLVDRMLGPNTLPREQPVNIHQVLERVRNLVTAEAPPGVRIVRDYDPSIPDTRADPDQLIQAVLNLVRNAVQAVGAEGEVILRTRTIRQVTIGHQHHKLGVRVDIIDNGPGVPVEMLERIFYPMVTGRADGTGLGLPIAQSLVQQHRGLIECTSEPGKTVFTILLPLEAHHEQ